MDENEITQRLRNAGDQSVPGDVRSTHLNQMRAAVPVVEKTKRFGRLAVAAAAFAGFAVGSTGFAMAGALPAPAQQVAHDVLAVVQVDVEDPKQNRGQCVSAAARANPVDEVAKKDAKSRCPKGKPAHAGKGKSDHAGQGKGKGKPAQAGLPGRPDDGDPCTGPPPWAGKGGKAMSPDAKAEAKTQRAACSPDAGDDQEDPAAEAAEDAAEQEREAAEDAAEREREAAEDADQAPRDQGGAPEQTPAAPPADLPEPAQPDAGADGTETETEAPAG